MIAQDDTAVSKSTARTRKAGFYVLVAGLLAIIALLFMSRRRVVTISRTAR